MCNFRRRPIMSKIFTNEYIKSITQSNFFERGFAGLMATNSYFKDLREKLEKIISKIPEEEVGNYILKLKSTNDIECLSAVSELFIFERLSSQFSDVEIEMPIKIIDNKTPDFWVDKEYKFAVEVATVFEQINPLEYEIIETLNNIESEIKIMLSTIWNIKGRKEQIKLKKIKQQFESLFEENKNITELKPFNIQTDEGIILRGKLYKGNKSHSTVGSRNHSYGFDIEDPDYKKIVRKRILQKLRRYKKLTTNEIPLIVVLYNRVSWINEIRDWDEIIYGDKEYIFKTNSLEVEKISRRNTVIGPDKNTTLSAIVTNNLLEKDTYFYIENPYARAKVNGALKNKLLKAFNAKEIKELPINKIT